ncbi:21928_t:CDS:2, partial [Racocetra persica]
MKHIEKKDIDNLIKETHNNQPEVVIEWIPYEDFTNIEYLREGIFSEIYKATCSKGTIKSWDRIEKVVLLKVVKDSQNINSTFLNELRNIVKCQPNSDMHHIIHCYGISQDPIILNSRYWDVDKIFLEAEDRRQELLNSGEFPPPKPLLSVLVTRSNLFQNIISDSINIIPEHLKNDKSLNLTNMSTSKKHSVEFSINKNDYNEIKRRKLSDNDSTINPSTSKKHTTEFLINKNDKDEIKRRKLSEN